MFYENTVQFAAFNLARSKRFFTYLTILFLISGFAHGNDTLPLSLSVEMSPLTAPKSADTTKAPNLSPGITSIVNGNVTTDKKTNNDADMMQAQATVLNELPKRLVMYVGQMSLIKIPSVTRVGVGNGKVVSANMIDKNTMLVTAMDAGDSTLHVWDKVGAITKVKVRVNVADNERTIEELRDLTSNIPNISIRRVGERVVVSGGNLDPSAVERVNMLAKLYPNTISLATVDRIRTDRMVDIQVKFMEFSKSAIDSLGIEWQSVSDGFSFGLFSDLSTNGKFRTLPPGSSFSSTATGFPGADLG